MMDGQHTEESQGSIGIIGIPMIQMIDNTSRIERLWGELRAFIRNIYSAGVVEGNAAFIIQELLWRKRCREFNLNIVDSLVEILVRY